MDDLDGDFAFKTPIGGMVDGGHATACYACADRVAVVDDRAEQWIWFHSSYLSKADQSAEDWSAVSWRLESNLSNTLIPSNY